MQNTKTTKDPKTSRARSRTSQHEQAVAFIGDFRAADDVIGDALDGLDVVIGEAQNEPPEGAADGSIGQTEWLALKAVRDHALEMRRALQRLQHVAGYER